MELVLGVTVKGELGMKKVEINPNKDDPLEILTYI